MFTEKLTPIVLRFVAYTFFIFTLTALLPYMFQHTGISLFKEGGVIEWLQFSMLACTSIIFLAGSTVLTRYSHFLISISALVAFAAVRELDMVLDNLLPFVGWKIGFLFMVFAIGFAVINRKMVVQQVAVFIYLRAFAIFWAGFIMAVPVSQLIGHGEFLQLMMGDEYTRDYKRVIEESGEFVGYFLILVASIESLIQLHWAYHNHDEQTIGRYKIS